MQFRVIALSVDGNFDGCCGVGPSAIVSGTIEDLRRLPLDGFVVSAESEAEERRLECLVIETSLANSVPGHYSATNNLAWTEACAALRAFRKEKGTRT